MSNNGIDRGSDVLLIAMQPALSTSAHVTAVVLFKLLACELNLWSLYTLCVYHSGLPIKSEPNQETNTRNLHLVAQY